MQKESWENLLRQIPAIHHNGLVLATVNGKELIIQSVVATEDEFLIIRGRPAGTSDGAKVAVVPYQQINYILFNKRLAESEITGMFGESSFSAAAGAGNEASIDPSPNGESHELDPEKESLDVTQPLHSANDGKAGQKKPSKTILLAKLRERLVDKPQSG